MMIELLRVQKRRNSDMSRATDEETPLVINVNHIVSYTVADDFDGNTEIHMINGPIYFVRDTVEAVSTFIEGLKVEIGGCRIRTP